MVGTRKQPSRSRSYKAFAAEFLILQGLATLKSFGQRATRQNAKEKADHLFSSTMWVLANSLARGITDTGIAVGAAATLALGAFRVAEGSMDEAPLIMILMLGVEVYGPLRDMRSLMHNGMVVKRHETIFTFSTRKLSLTRRPWTIRRRYCANGRF